MSTTDPRPRAGRPPTLEDVAARAGVSRALVSIVMRDVAGASEATRQRVRSIADEMGYLPDHRARQLASRHQRLIGVTVALNNPFHADVAEAMYAAAAAAGYQIALSAVAPSRSAGVAVDSLLAQRCDALILLGAPGRRRPTGGRRVAVPTVLVGQRGEGTDSVRVDEAAGLALAVDHLVALGHRAITHLDGGRAAGSAARRAGYRHAMRAVGLTSVVAPGGDDETDGAVSALALLAGTPPTAVVTYNDRSAVGLLDTFVRAGLRVPDDVSIVGFDDSNVARLPYVGLTTIGQDAERLAELAVRRAIERIEAGADAAGARPVDLVLPPRLVARRTTGPPRTAPLSTSSRASPDRRRT